MLTSIYALSQQSIVENYYQKKVKNNLEGKKKVLPLHPLSGTERKFSLLKACKTSSLKRLKEVQQVPRTKMKSVDFFY